MDDNTTELSEYFNVMITSTDQPGAVEIGPSDMALVTFEDNDPGVCAQLKVFVHSCVFVCEYIMGCDKCLVYKCKSSHGDQKALFQQQLNLKYNTIS